MLQTTFAGTLEPIAPHPEDMIDCEDTGAWKRRADCVESVDGKFWSDDEERYDHELYLVEEYLEGVVEWSDEYHATDDCVGEYAYLIWENPERITDNVRSALEEALGDDCDNLTDDLVDDIVDALAGHVDHTTSRSHTPWSGLDVEFDSFDIGEVEEQISINEVDLLRDLHARGDLEGFLEEWSSQYCLFCIHHAIYTDGVFTGKYEYGPYVQGGDTYPSITLTNDTGLWYHFGCSTETLLEVYDECREGAASAV